MNANHREELINNIIQRFNAGLISFLTCDEPEMEDPPVSLQLANAFIADNTALIRVKAEEMFESYEADNELDALNNPEEDLIDEFIYDGGELEDNLYAFKREANANNANNDE